MDRTVILKCLVGSRAHGLHNEDSDHDYRGVYVIPTKEILSIGHKYKGSHWLEGETDQTSYEIGHFLQLATKCNPTILEVFKAPMLDIHPIINEFAEKLRDLFPYCWNPNDVFNAFVGYGCNQRKKFLEKKDKRGPKYAVAYIRTLYNLIDLLRDGEFDLEVKNSLQKEMLLEIKDDKWSDGKVIDLANKLIQQAEITRDTCKHRPDIEKVNEYLMYVRESFWNGEPNWEEVERARWGVYS